ncbi:uncharacterized protein [Blastocystis hominis]|uniref:Uncharacterized protein n=1 Tax=Blastocystis hominis TaxID=12968 RepID=D8M1Z8_BLAHO|nr:uncharacterized protein [Blastocystis hominis]CBK22087.2 unnamed protein product [Blastocystis hominis]|eukprot:XP_012896135.1 uncharacterized protein [Blastocystis hominis]
MLDNQSKRCVKESKIYEKRMRDEIAKGNQDTAKIYADSCVRLRNQAKQFMVMSCRVEAAALTMQQMYSMSSISSAMATSVRAIKGAAESMNLERMYKVTNDFKEACEDNNVMIAGFSNAFSEQSVDASEDSQALYEQAAMEYANKSGDSVQNAPLGDVSMPVNEPAQATSDLVNRLNNL